MELHGMGEAPASRIWQNEGPLEELLRPHRDSGDDGRWQARRGSGCSLSTTEVFGPSRTRQGNMGERA
eukprot:2706691-Karenia_brevis.AAC.1